VALTPLAFSVINIEAAISLVLLYSYSNSTLQHSSSVSIVDVLLVLLLLVLLVLLLIAINARPSGVLYDLRTSFAVTFSPYCYIVHGCITENDYKV
jgi:hypothetical protein